MHFQKEHKSWLAGLRILLCRTGGRFAARFSTSPRRIKTAVHSFVFQLAASLLFQRGARFALSGCKIHRDCVASRTRAAGRSQAVQEERVRAKSMIKRSGYARSRQPAGVINT